ncbi:hypothetical protein LOTGIDRAFT_174600 [Lottia gigantea]|uniref:Uncharacterized protein n=1 Tax=Lottia gigantea TaxID=225164 RepID=V3ZZY9_LOTGI|nr:hypothetical protein LOTGIDRAFT_174600 [Lottia gigantea]ESO97118.1 hypothetical protein LOTGIDRAFT_174600 [Lottia gigantea]
MTLLCLGYKSRFCFPLEWIHLVMSRDHMTCDTNFERLTTYAKPTFFMTFPEGDTNWFRHTCSNAPFISIELINKNPIEGKGSKEQIIEERNGSLEHCLQCFMERNGILEVRQLEKH